MVSMRRTLTVAAILSLCIPAFGLVGCGSSGDDDDDSGNAGSTAAGSGSNAGSSGGGQPMGTGNDLPILFSPMYSGYDGQNTYQIPAIVSGVTDVDWKADPADAVDIEKDANSGGVLIVSFGPKA